MVALSHHPDNWISDSKSSVRTIRIDLLAKHNVLGWVYRDGADPNTEWLRYHPVSFPEL